MITFSNPCILTIIASVSALNLETSLEVDITALVKHEFYSEHASEPCTFPDVKQFNTEEYLAQSASCKKRQIWQNVIKDKHVNRWFDGADLLPLFLQDMNLSFDHNGDTMPDNRVKMTHPRGVTMKVAFRPTANSPYTGIFRGAKHGILRVSEVVRTDKEITITSPGFGIKFLRDGMDSANTVAMFSFDGQPSYNYFENRWSTHLNEPLNECARETIGKKLAEVTDHIGAMSVMNWGEYTESGVKEQRPVWPFILDFEPIDAYGWTDAWQADFTDQLSSITPGTVLWKVFAFSDPKHKLSGSRGDLIGRVVLTSEITTSLWGDKSLFFKHQRIDDDLEVHTWWKDYMQTWSLGKMAETPLVHPQPTELCPFAFLFEMF